jgi:pyruvate,water dikinase
MAQPDAPAHFASRSILPLDSADATLSRVGGKGANLARLARAGFPVPPGFLVTTEAYRAFVAANDLAPRIIAAVNHSRADAPDELNAASDAIRGWFSSGAIPPEIADGLRAAYRALGSPPVAVRSSATAEDLPDMSFAGQQDTFLNIIGEEALLVAVVKCWSSLWTARAIGYRARNRLPHDHIALAVVVQTMIPSEAAGVLFTANPLTGLRTETVIDATVGLGEALVSGQVEPDHYVVETATGKILGKTLGAKAIAIRGKADGGVVTLREDASRQPALPDEQIRALAALGARVHAEYNFPQDIEWAWAGGRLHLLQSRPITSLYPVPDGLPPEPLRVMFSFGAVQGMLDPWTPLGQDAVRHVIVAAATLLGYRTTYGTQGVIRIAGERLWADITSVIRNGVGREAARTALSFVEPSVGRIVEKIWDDPRLALQRRAPSVGAIWHILHLLLPLAFNVQRFLRNPDRRRGQIIQQVEQVCEDFRARYMHGGDRHAALAHRLAALGTLWLTFVRVMPALISGLVSGMAAFNILLQIAKRLPPGTDGRDRSQLVLELTRGLPHNVTTEMDLSLWQTARALKADTSAADYAQRTPADQLAAEYLRGELPDSAHRAVEAFLRRYGFRGLAEIDLGRPRWREDSAPVMQALQSYLRIEDENQAPDAVFKRGEQAARAALDQLEAAARATRGGWLKARIVRLLAQRMRASIGMRESPKFYIVRIMGIVREGLLESGRDFAAAGELERPDDVFFLRLPELEELAQVEDPLQRGAARDWRALAAARRAVYQREKLRRQIPRLLLSDGRAFYEGLNDAPPGADGNVIVGSPVSPGLVEGAVRVVFDPHAAQLAPGEILVCPGTDPSWTPLFLAAGGLVMEVGGMMTHGSVVAREYGIPAVVGVDRATQRLQTGQRIRVDGSSGQIVILSE